MQSILYRLLAALAVALFLTGCAKVPYESAMDWLQRQPHIMEP